MNLFIISTEFPPGPGGIGTHAYQVAYCLARRGWEVSVLSPQDYASEEEIQAFNQAQPFRILRQYHHAHSMVDGMIRLLNIDRLAHQSKPDLLLASGDRAVWLAALHNLFRPTPWAAVAHGGIEFGTKVGWERRMTQWAYPSASAVICVSQYASNEMYKNNTHPHKVVVIHNGADENTFQMQQGDERPTQLRQRLGLENAFVLLTVGNVTERKGQEVVIRALPEILKQGGASVHYIMVGLPTLKPKLEKLALELGVTEHVHFLGRMDTDTLVSAYNACNVFLMTSRRDSRGDSEGYGIAVIEAALCGKPAIVSNASGLIEAVVDGQTGLHVPENDPHATAQAVLQLVGNPELCQRLGQQAHQRAINEGTWNKRVDAYENTLLELMQAQKH